LQLAYGQIKLPKTLDQAVQFVSKGLASTNDEAKKIQFISLLVGIAKSLQYLQNEEKSPL
jgi:hypothetical protein